MAHGSHRAVAAAIIGNFFVMVAKTGVFFITGSAAMLSEAMHSLADTLNQVLLMVGIRRSSRVADPRFPFGYGGERAVWALMSAVGIFFLGCGVTVYHGILSLLNPHELEGLGWAVGVLIVSFVVEFAVLVLAVRTVHKEARGKPFMAYLRFEADPTAVAVVMEDSAACLGVVIALGGIFAAHWTGNSAWDAVASILIGLLLGAIAIWLVARTSHLLVGPSIPPDARQRVREILSGNPVVEKIVALRTRMLDSETYRVSAEIEFSGEILAAKVEKRFKGRFPDIAAHPDYPEFSAKFADCVVEELGDQIDLIEDAIQRAIPKAHYLDIEAD
ncbi:MAG: cation diffusion facilitator family transporter [Acidobacteria bacterium]|nr:cation diffusion facilitator family transporter [Acidobacteriota bacterium]